MREVAATAAGAGVAAATAADDETTNPSAFKLFSMLFINFEFDESAESAVIESSSAAAAFFFAPHDIPQCGFGAARVVSDAKSDSNSSLVVVTVNILFLKKRQLMGN